MHTDIFSELDDQKTTLFWATLCSFVTVAARSAQDRSDPSPRARALDGYNEILHSICSQIVMRLTKSHRSFTDEAWLQLIADLAKEHGITSFESVVEAARIQLNYIGDHNERE